MEHLDLHLHFRQRCVSHEPKDDDHFTIAFINPDVYKDALSLFKIEQIPEHTTITIDLMATSMSTRDKLREPEEDRIKAVRIMQKNLIEDLAEIRELGIAPQKEV
ncbi:unnamed protein product, partial [Allacma fusca]